MMMFLSLQLLMLLRCINSPVYKLIRRWMLKFYLYLVSFAQQPTPATAFPLFDFFVIRGLEIINSSGDGGALHRARRCFQRDQHPLLLRQLRLFQQLVITAAVIASHAAAADSTVGATQRRWNCSRLPPLFLDVDGGRHRHRR